MDETVSKEVITSEANSGYTESLHLGHRHSKGIQRGFQKEMTEIEKPGNEFHHKEEEGYK